MSADSGRATTRMRIAAIQMLSTPTAAANLASAAALIAEAAAQGAQLVALPEFFAAIDADAATRAVMREAFAAGPLQDFLAAAAQRHGLWLIGGSLPLSADAPALQRNSCLVFNPDGACVVRYDKAHLFSFCCAGESHDEGDIIEAGPAAPVVFDAPCGRVGLGICYDLRFPELFRAMGEIDLLALPAAFTAVTGRAHWRVLLRARAIENQCYVLAAAQGGRHASGRRTWGRSMIIDPWGKVLACREEDGPGVVVADFDAAVLRKVRSRLPALRHRRL